MCLRILIDAFCKRSHRHVPVRVHWYTCENGRQDSCETTCDAETHGDVDWYSRVLKSEDAPVLQED